MKYQLVAAQLCWWRGVCLGDGTVKAMAVPVETAHI